MAEQPCKRGRRLPVELEEAKQLKGGFRIHFEIAVNSHSYLPVLATFTTKILELQHQHFGLRDHSISF